MGFDDISELIEFESMGIKIYTSKPKRIEFAFYVLIMMK